jgi:hypothetical protein
MTITQLATVTMQEYPTRFFFPDLHVECPEKIFQRSVDFIFSVHVKLQHITLNVKLFLGLIKHHDMKTNGGVEV